MLPPNVTAVFHVAGDTSLSTKENEKQTRVNVMGTENIVAAALARGATRFIHTSTCSAYGRHREPITEETATTADRSEINYEKSKWLAEEAVRAGVSAGLDAIIVNPFAILGPGDRAGWAVLFQQLKAGAMPFAPPGVGVFSHVDDVAAAHISAYARGRTGENYLLPGVEATFAELIAQMCKCLGIDRVPSVAPSWLFLVLAHVEKVRSSIAGGEPALTPEMAKLMSAHMRCGSTKAIDELGCSVTPLSRSVSDAHEWLVSQELI